jgi:3-isopropylmalate/(R)-2-methylmalate dehydratase small subunit
VSEDPSAEVVVDLERQAVRGEGFEYRFEIDAFAREMLLQGQDDISLVERHEDEIAAYEKRRAEWLAAPARSGAALR